MCKTVSVSIMQKYDNTWNSVISTHVCISHYGKLEMLYVIIEFIDGMNNTVRDCICAWGINANVSTRCTLIKTTRNEPLYNAVSRCTLFRAFSLLYEKKMCMCNNEFTSEWISGKQNCIVWRTCLSVPAWLWRTWVRWKVERCNWNGLQYPRKQWCRNVEICESLQHQSTNWWRYLIARIYLEKHFEDYKLGIKSS